MYQALYRKYRPKVFDDVVGQDFVIKTLKNAIIYNKVSHAYLFYGPRGIGKTTIAKIFARAVNCEKSKDGNPCDICSSCIKSKENQTVDIIEIDAASNNGVDEIREIKSKVNIVPSDLKYKVYIIDEVHMLTSGAFNALLKTLEEPPKHVIFILATTDPQKVSETIVSRCQCYSFKRINEKSIVEKLNKICKEEKICIDEDVLKQIAISSNGGLRDSISSLDKISSYKQELITMEDYLEINDMISNKKIEEFIEIILSGDVKKFILEINEYYYNGKNLIEIINQVICYLRDIMIEYYLKNKILKFKIESYQALVELLNEKMFDIKKASTPNIYIEIMILKFIENIVLNSKEMDQNISQESQNFKNEKNISQEIILGNKKEEMDNNQPKDLKVYESDVNQQENQSMGMISSDNRENQESFEEKSNIYEIMTIRLNNALAQADKKEKKQCEIDFKKLNDSVFDQDIGYVVSELLNSTIRVVSKDILIISYEYDSVVNQNLRELSLFQSVLEKETGINKKIGIITDDMWELEKQKYIKSTKNNQKYVIIEEPELIDMNIERKSNKFSELSDFGDIVEIN